MKRLLIFLFLLTGVMSFSSINEVVINNKALNVENGYVLFNKEKYTGRIHFNLGEDSGYFNLVNGYLDGKTDVNFRGLILKFNVVDGYYEGELIKKLRDNERIEMFFENRELKRYAINHSDFTLNIKFNTYGKANGEIIFKNQNFKDEYFKKFGIKTSENKLVYKNGTVIMGDGKTLKFYIDKNTKKIVEEFYEDNKLIKKFDEEVSKADVKEYQKFLIQIIE